MGRPSISNCKVLHWYGVTVRTPVRVQNEVDAVDVGGPIDNRVVVTGVSLDVEIGHVRIVVLRGVPPNWMTPLFGDRPCRHKWRIRAPRGSQGGKDS